LFVPLDLDFPKLRRLQVVLVFPLVCRSFCAEEGGLFFAEGGESLEEGGVVGGDLGFCCWVAVGDGNGDVVVVVVFGGGRGCGRGGDGGGGWW
jgi:hypothetical protein